MLPVQLDLSKLSHPILPNIVVPILPGGIIALGWLFGHEAVWGSLHDERTLKIIAVGFAIYVIGMVLSYLSEFELALALVLVVSPGWSDLSTNSEWRKLASEFLGSELSPPHEEPLSQQQCDDSWKKWYGILSAYFPVTKNFVQVFGSFYFRTLNSVGWAGLLSAYICSRHVNWMIWAGCGLAIAISHVTYPLNFLKQAYDSRDQLTAEILKAIKNSQLTKIDGATAQD